MKSADQKMALGKARRGAATLSQTCWRAREDLGLQEHDNSVHTPAVHDVADEEPVPLD